MKTYMNNNLLTNTVEKIKLVEYYEQTVKFIARFIEDVRNNIIEKCASFAQSYLLHKVLKRFGRERHDALKKEMDQLYRQTCFYQISIKDLTPQEKRRYQEDIMILD